MAYASNRGDFFFSSQQEKDAAERRAQAKSDYNAASANKQAAELEKGARDLEKQSA